MCSDSVQAARPKVGRIGDEGDKVVIFIERDPIEGAGDDQGGQTGATEDDAEPGQPVARAKYVQYLEPMVGAAFKDLGPPAAAHENVNAATAPLAFGMSPFAEAYTAEILIPQV